MKILIIKLGLSETLDPEVGQVSSLGDVLRTTPILHVLKETYPESNITWLADKNSVPLLYNNHFIDRILAWDEFTGFQLMVEKFDILINLEKIGGLCALSNVINAWKKFGFRFDEVQGHFNVFSGSEYAFSMCSAKEIKEKNNKIWQEILVEMIGGTWQNQPYVLNPVKHYDEIFDIGFNYKVGTKFPEKAWPDSSWKELEGYCSEKSISVSWQEGLANIHEYIDWIQKCSMIITSDSLGLHIALALKKKVIALFGPTNSKEVFMYGLGLTIQEKAMSDITAKTVFAEVEKLRDK